MRRHRGEADPATDAPVGPVDIKSPGERGFIGPVRARDRMKTGLRKIGAALGGVKKKYGYGFKRGGK